MNKLIIAILFLCSVLFSAESDESNIRKFRVEFIEKNYTFETEHFRIHYEDNLESQARRVAQICENLYSIYRNKYGITLPNKTEVLVADEAVSNGWALAIQNTIGIWVHDFDWNLRGSPNWLENVVAHEYAHIVSISASFKMPSWMPYIQFGSFTHSNTPNRTEALYIYPSEILPPWFFEGIAQYESTMQNGDSWDSHRDMIFRRLVQSDKMQSWDQMSVFNGRFDSYEKTYNHGFGLVKYIAETYGYDKVIAITKESSRFGRLVFDNAIERVLGISGRELYREWNKKLKIHYAEQIKTFGDTTSSQIINNTGYNTFWPKFSRDEKRIYFLSNGDRDHPRMRLWSYNLLDTVPDSSAYRLEIAAVNGFYSLHPDSSRVLYSSVGAPDAFVENLRWQENVWDLYTYPLAPDSVKEPKFRKKNRVRISEMENLISAVYSSDGKQIASVHQNRDRASLWISDSDGKNRKKIYPLSQSDSLALHSIYSLDWSNDGSKIAIGYLDRDNRKVGWYDLKAGTFIVLQDSLYDCRDPRFSEDSKRLYFSSNRKLKSFNIYRYSFETGITEQVTNTIGGAFTPDPSKDETRLLYSSYTADGYQIMMADSVKALSADTIAAAERTGFTPPPAAVGGIPTRYSHFPRKPLVIPTIISEEVLAKSNNAFEGVRNTKAGAIVGLMDPLAWRESRGNQLMFFFLTESYFRQVHEILKVEHSLADLSAAYRFATDFGVLGSTQMFPFDLKMSWFTRNIPSVNPILHNSYGYDTLEYTNYSIQPMMSDLQISYPIGPITVNGYASIFNYRVQIDIGSGKKQYLNYDPSQSVRTGLTAVHTQTQYTRKSAVSPHRFAVKAQYEFNAAKYVDPNEQIKVNKKGFIEENYNNFNYHILKGTVKKSRASFINPLFDFEWGVNGLYLQESDKNRAKFPSLYLPAVQVPGYAYFYQPDSVMHVIHPDRNNSSVIDTVYVPNDSIVAGGKVIAGISGSYRFPLWKGEIDKKLGFIYFDKLYGAVNGGGVCTALSGRDALQKTLDDWLFHAGAEIRLSTIAFNNYPLAVKFRWDNGLNRENRVGGNRFTFAIGFEFDNWTIVESPDGFQENFRPAYLK